nr:MAG TPA: hypothetical protein [Caudoviricetes sp.]
MNILFFIIITKFNLIILKYNSKYRNIRSFYVIIIS